MLHDSAIDHLNRTEYIIIRNCHMIHDNLGASIIYKINYTVFTLIEYILDLLVTLTHKWGLESPSRFQKINKCITSICFCSIWNNCIWEFIFLHNIIHISLHHKEIYCVDRLLEVSRWVGWVIGQSVKQAGSGYTHKH